MVETIVKNSNNEENSKTEEYLSIPQFLELSAKLPNPVNVWFLVQVVFTSEQLVCCSISPKLIVIIKYLISQHSN